MKTTFEKRKGRNIIVDDVCWKYIVGQGNAVAHSEKGVRLCEDLDKIKGLLPDLVVRGRWKKSGDGMVTPKDIEQWIRRSNS